MKGKSERAKGKIQIHNENVRYQQPGTFFNLNIDDYSTWEKYRLEIFSMPHTKTEIDIPIDIANQIAMWILAKCLPEEAIEKICKELGLHSDAFKGLHFVK